MESGYSRLFKIVFICFSIIISILLVNQIYIQRENITNICERHILSSIIIGGIIIVIIIDYIKI